MGEVLARKLTAHPEYRLKVVGVLAVGHEDATDSPDLPLLGRTDDVEHVAVSYGVSRVVITPQGLDDDVLEDLLRRCRATALKVSILPRLSAVLGPAVEIDDVEGVTVLGINPPWLPRSSRALKRVMDVVVASVLLVLSAPVMLVLALAIKLDTPGPVFFVQERVGRRGRHFRLFKFRTMGVDAEQRRAEMLDLSTDPNWLKLDHDPRITRLGQYLRRLSLDEIPQLWNVLRGEMSIVGPRPLILAEDERVQDWARGRLDLMPGITGYWQVLGRTRIPFEEMVKLDYLYVMNWSLWEDVRLILRTLPTVLGGRGAN
jgi:exopolysaccharide biosynthesis polyprenyl glycosylphosphotransferase